MHDIVQEFLVESNENLDQLESELVKLEAGPKSTSHQITANSEETSAQARVVSEAGEHINHNLQTIATGAEEMSATVNEIAKNAMEAGKVAAEAVTTSEETNATVGKLGASSAEIGKALSEVKRKPNEVEGPRLVGSTPDLAKFSATARAGAHTVTLSLYSLPLDGSPDRAESTSTKIRTPGA